MRRLARSASAWLGLAFLLGLVLAAGSVTLTGAAVPAPRDTGCVVVPLSGSVDAHQSASPSSAVIGQLTASQPGHGCTFSAGADYTVCGGGSVWVLTRIAAGSGYVPEACVDIVS